MKLRLFLTLSLLLLSAAGHVPASRAQSHAPSTLLIIRNATLIDGIAPQPVRGATVVVRGGKIESISSGPVEVSAGATVLDLKGRWLLPGLIDAHVHFVDPDAARTALASGVTTARSRAMVPRKREMLTRALQLGVRVVAGSDARYDDERRL